MHSTFPHWLAWSFDYSVFYLFSSGRHRWTQFSLLLIFILSSPPDVLFWCIAEPMVYPHYISPYACKSFFHPTRPSDASWSHNLKSLNRQTGRHESLRCFSTASAVQRVLISTYSSIHITNQVERCVMILCPLPSRSCMQVNNIPLFSFEEIGGN